MAVSPIRRDSSRPWQSPLTRARSAGETTLARNLASAFMELSRANEPEQVDPAIRYARSEGTHRYETLGFPNQGDAAAILHALESTVRDESTHVGDWSAIEALIGSVPGPEDAAREHDHYIYGSPKRAQRK